MALGPLSAEAARYLDDEGAVAKRRDGTLFLNADATVTLAQIEAAQDSPEFATWLAEHGGDPLATLRRGARELVDSTDTQEVRSRASDIEILLYARDVCASLRQLLAGIAAASNLGDVKTAAAAITPPPAPANNAAFLAGARAAVKARIENGEADT